MLAWEKKIPEYLTSRRNTVSFILFTAVFALVFINIYSPFSAEKWRVEGNIGEVRFFLYSSVVILIGMLVIVMSRILMYLYTRRRSMAYGVYAVWIVTEIVALALVYAIIRFFVFEGVDFSIIFRNTVRTTAFIIMLPYFISWLYLSFRDKYTALEKMENSMPGQGGFKQESVLSMIPFRDEKGVLRFSIKKDNLLYLEAADNYVIIHYLDLQKPARYMIRNTLKHFESELPNAGLVRCHRSFMVNIDNVKLIRKEKDGLIIGFDTPVEISVPISKSYIDIFIRRLSGYSLIE